MHLAITEMRRLLFTLHPVDYVLTDEVLTELQHRYTLAQNAHDSLLTLHSFVHCCCRVVCMLGTAAFIRFVGN